MATVSVIGAGELGGAIAHALARGARVRRVTLIDPAGAIAAGKALDMQQSGAVDGFHTQVSGTDDITRVTGCAVCVMADRAGPPRGEWSGEDGLSLLARLSGYLGAAPVVFAGASQAPLLLAGSREAGIGRERLVGSAAEAFAAAATAIVALEARCSPGEVTLAVLGAPPSPSPPDGSGAARAGLVVPWSEASIGGYALERVLTQVQLARLEQRLARLWPPGPFALGLAAARVAEAMVLSSRRTFTVVSVLGGEFGVRGRVGCLPAWLSPRGIAQVRVPILNPRERVQIETALS